MPSSITEIALTNFLSSNNLEISVFLPHCQTWIYFYISTNLMHVQGYPNFILIDISLIIGRWHLVIFSIFSSLNFICITFDYWSFLFFLLSKNVSFHSLSFIAILYMLKISPSTLCLFFEYNLYLSFVCFMI